MKFLFVNHTFPPESYAGSELCVFNLARSLKQMGHEVRVLYRVADSQKDELLFEESTHQEIPVVRVNNTYRYAHTFQDIYINPSLDAKFACLLRQWQPDVVHFHHITNLSLGMVQEAKAAEAVVVFTLHDYWLLCQRGQLLKRDLQLCQGPGDSACRRCLSVQLLRGRRQRWVSGLLNLRRHSQARRNTLALWQIPPTKIDTPNKQFTGKTAFGMGEGKGQVLLAHPPAEWHFSLPESCRGEFYTAVALHPDTYGQPGEGVRFAVLVDEELYYTKELNPKHHWEDRGWHEVRFSLPQGCRRLILRTQAQAGDDNQHCTAGWRAPQIALETDDAPKTKLTPPLFSRGLRQGAEWLADRLALLSSASAEGIAHRKNWVQRVWQDVDLFISPSQFLRDFFIRHGLPAKKIVFSDNGFQMPASVQPKKIQPPLCFGYIGTWIPSKGVDLAVRAFADVDPSQAKLVVHGFFPGYDGQENYEQRLRAQSSPAVEFRGQYEPEGVYELLAEIDCLIVPSIWWENSPMTIHEAFLAGVPVLTADVGGMAEQVRDGGGLTFRHRDAEHLREVVHDLIRHPHKLQALPDSIPRVKSVQAHTQEMLTYYHRLLNERRATAQ